MTDLADAGVRRLLELYRNGTASPIEAVTACLQRIERLDPALNAVTTLCAEAALAAAHRSSARWRRGEPRPLEGIPFGLKDVLMTAGIRTTGGSGMFADYVPNMDAAAARSLADAGAILVAKLQTFAFALGGPANRSFGWTRNPWDEQRIAGGSSSGPAAALAARMLPLALGTDTGGSIRLPAAYCGVAGLRPTFARVPRAGVMLLTWTLDTVGPMARDAADLEVVLPVLTASREHVRLRTDLDGVRIGVPRRWFFEHCSNEVADGVEQALTIMTGLGATTVELDLPKAEIADAVGRTIVTVEAGSLHEELIVRADEYEPALAARLLAARSVTALDYARALRLRQVVEQELGDLFSRVDVIVTPTSAVLAPRYAELEAPTSAEANEWRRLVTRSTFPFSLAGVPAVSVPAPPSRSGMPVGVQIAAAQQRDELCLRVAAIYERARG